MANYKIEEIEGIGPALGKKLREAGVTNTDKLLEHTKTKSQRKNLAEKADISEKQILKFANMADLFRISGVGQEYAELLEASGVDTVPALAQRNGANLTAKMEQINGEKKLARRTPTVAVVEKWIIEAKELPRALTY
jgi:predicted flap endonuclease-1-like 5' DNA nuclease